MLSGSAFHQIDVFDRDRAAIAEIHDQDGKPDGGFGRRDGQHDKRVDLAHEVAEKGRKRNQIEVDGEQYELDRHHDDDDVLPVEENAKDAEREQDRGDGQVVAEPDGHDTPCPLCTLTTSMAVALVRATCSATFCRLTLGLWRNVNTMAPTMATSRTRPEAWKK